MTRNLQIVTTSLFFLSLPEAEKNSTFLVARVVCITSNDGALIHHVERLSSPPVLHTEIKQLDTFQLSIMFWY